MKASACKASQPVVVWFLMVAALECTMLAIML